MREIMFKRNYNTKITIILSSALVFEEHVHGRSDKTQIKISM